MWCVSEWCRNAYTSSSCNCGNLQLFWLLLSAILSQVLAQVVTYMTLLVRMGNMKMPTFDAYDSYNGTDTK